MTGNNLLYKEIKSAKNGELIPLLYNDRFIESSYNPQKDAERMLESLSPAKFFLVLGIGSGIFISKLHEKYPDSFILAFEYYAEDIELLQTLETNKKLFLLQNVKFCCHEDIILNLQNFYIPHFYGNLQIVENKNWISEIQKLGLFEDIQSMMQKALRIISADYSVQAHFGKIWQQNILNNLKIASKLKNIDAILKIDNSKTAYIIAAGPSLDNSIKMLNDKNAFIISTDTAFSALIKQNIIPDVVISIDGQNISHNHFFQISNNLCKKTLFVLDLCSDFSTADKILELNYPLIFSVSGHPFSTFANSISTNNFIELFAGSGTVTIAAVDFAIKTGFEKIEILGADFAYINGKSYTKGTYFDEIFFKNQNKIENSETAFNQLMYRTEFSQKKENFSTTKILEAYEFSLYEYCNINSVEICKKDNVFYLTNKNNKTFTNISLYNPFDYEKFCQYLLESIENSKKSPNKNTIFELNKSDISVLPLISWLKYYDNKNKSFSQLLSEAYDFLQSKL